MLSSALNVEIMKKENSQMIMEVTRLRQYIDQLKIVVPNF
jgi:hypothetical protein